MHAIAQFTQTIMYHYLEITVIIFRITAKTEGRFKVDINKVVTALPEYVRTTQRNTRNAVL